MRVRKAAGPDGISPELSEPVLCGVDQYISSFVSLMSIQGTETEAVQFNRYLGVPLKNKLKWTDKTIAHIKERPVSSLPIEKTTESTPEILL